MLRDKVRWIKHSPADAAETAVAPPPVPHPELWSRGQDRTPPPPQPPPPPRLLTCPGCGHADAGPLCSQCGEDMVPQATTPMRALLEHAVVERLVDLLALVKTSWLMLTGPVAFFRAVLQQKSALADAPFFLSSAWARLSPRPQKVLNPVRYLILVGGISLFMQWLAGVDPNDALPDWATEIATVLVVAAYSFLLSLMLGGRIPGADLTRFALYYNGLVTLVFSALLSFAQTEPGALFALAVLLVLGIGLPFVVLPALFGVTRTRLFLANVGVGVMAMGMVFLVAMAVELMGGAASPDTFAQDSVPAVEADTFAMP